MGKIRIYILMVIIVFFSGFALYWKKSTLTQLDYSTDSSAISTPNVYGTEVIQTAITTEPTLSSTPIQYAITSTPTAERQSSESKLSVVPTATLQSLDDLVGESDIALDKTFTGTKMRFRYPGTFKQVTAQESFINSLVMTLLDYAKFETKDFTLNVILMNSYSDADDYTRRYMLARIGFNSYKEIQEKRDGRLYSIIQNIGAEGFGLIHLVQLESGEVLILQLGSSINADIKSMNRLLVNISETAFSSASKKATNELSESSEVSTNVVMASYNQDINIQLTADQRYFVTWQGNAGEVVRFRLRKTSAQLWTAFKTPTGVEFDLNELRAPFESYPIPIVNSGIYTLTFLGPKALDSKMTLSIEKLSIPLVPLGESTEIEVSDELPIFAFEGEAGASAEITVTSIDAPDRAFTNAFWPWSIQFGGYPYTFWHSTRPITLFHNGIHLVMMELPREGNKFHVLVEQKNADSGVEPFFHPDLGIKKIVTRGDLVDLMSLREVSVCEPFGYPSCTVAFFGSQNETVTITATNPHAVSIGDEPQILWLTYPSGGNVFSLESLSDDSYPGDPPPAQRYYDPNKKIETQTVWGPFQLPEDGYYQVTFNNTVNFIISE